MDDPTAPIVRKLTLLILPALVLAACTAKPALAPAAATTRAPTVSAAPATTPPVVGGTPRLVISPRPAKTQVLPGKLPAAVNLTLEPELFGTLTGAAPTSAGTSPTDRSPGVSPSEWNELPVMPGVIEGQEAGAAYLYAIAEPLVNVEAWYRQVMAERGWMLTSREEGEGGLMGAASLKLDFSKDGKNARIIIAISAQEPFTMVSLTVHSVKNPT